MTRRKTRWKILEVIRLLFSSERIYVGGFSSYVLVTISLPTGKATELSLALQCSSDAIALLCLS